MSIKHNFELLGNEIKDLISENKFLRTSNDAFIENSDDIIIIADLDGTITYTNPKGESLFGNILGKKCCDVTPLPSIIFSVDKYKDVIFDTRLNKILYVVAKKRYQNNKELEYIRIIDLNGETKLIVNLANQHKLF